MTKFKILPGEPPSPWVRPKSAWTKVNNFARAHPEKWIEVPRRFASGGITTYVKERFGLDAVSRKQPDGKFLIYIRFREVK